MTKVQRRELFHGDYFMTFFNHINIFINPHGYDANIGGNSFPDTLFDSIDYSNVEIFPIRFGY